MVTNTQDLYLTSPEQGANGKMGIGATSLGLSIYGRLTNKNHRYIEEMEQYILSKRQANGSWTISPLIKHNRSLVYTSCYVLQSLAIADYSKNIIYIEDGVKWLYQIVNEDGGWGFSENCPSHVHPTSEVLYLLSLLQGAIDQKFFLEAKNWLLQNRIDEEFWVNENRRPHLQFIQRLHIVVLLLMAIFRMNYGELENGF